MIKQGIKNYFTSFKYFFVPLGTTFLGLIIGLSILFPGVSGVLHNFVDDLSKIPQSFSMGFEEFIDSVTKSILALNWDEPLVALETMLSKEWLNSEVLSILNEFFTANMEEINALVNPMIAEVRTYFIICIVCVVLGFVGGYFLTRYLIRKDIARREFWKYFLISFIDTILTTTLVGICLWLLALWKFSVLISAIILLFVYSFIALVEAYITYGFGKINPREVLNTKNVGKLLLTNLIIFGISAVFTIAILLIFNSIAGIIIGVTLLEIAFIVISMNADSYVKEISSNNSGEKNKTEK